MTLSPVQMKPGVNSQLTQVQASGGWWSSNLIRWRDGGSIEKIAGWSRLIQEQAVGLIRAMHAWEDLSAVNQLLLGTDGGAQVYDGEGLYTFVFSRTETTASSITTVGGNATATVTTTTSDPAIVGENFSIVYYLTLGGIRYAPGTVFKILSRTDATHFVVSLPAPSLNSVAGAIPVFTNANVGAAVGFYQTTGVMLTAHGFTVGQTFSVQTYIGNYDNTFKSLVIGDYIVQQVISADLFTINSTMSVTTPGILYVAESIQGYPVNPPLPLNPPPFVPLRILLSGQPTTPQNWFLDNFGQVGLLNYSGSSLFQFTPPIEAIPPVAALVVGAPSIMTGMFVAMPQAQVVAFGCEVAGIFDPLLVRWSDTSDQNSWVASVTNQAGSFRLSQGSRIVGGIQGPRVGLIWTDLDVWLMQYSGPPFVYNFLEMATGCGLIAPKARLVLGTSVYWMGQKSFYSYDGNGVRSIPCTVWDFIFNDLDTDQINKINAGGDSSFNEGWFFFPSKSGGTGECDKYVKFTITDVGMLWDAGTLPRTSFIDSSVFGTLGGDLGRRIQQHDIGYDDDGVAMAGVYAETGYSSMGDGVAGLNEIIPDMKWFGDEPGAVMVTLKATNYPQQQPFEKGPYGLDMENFHIRPRIRGRFIAMRLEWVERLGFGARFGAFMFRTFFSGKRP